VTKDNFDKMVEHSLVQHPKEACGVLIRTRQGEEFVPINNVSNLPLESFILDPLGYAEAEDLGEVLAICHSHPDGSSRPSGADIIECNKGSIPWYIIGNEFTRVTRLVPEQVEAPLKGREFKHGMYDCYTLVCSYYKKKLGLTMGYYPTEGINWDQEGTDFFKNNFEYEGFTTIDNLEDIREHDALLFKVFSPVVNHAAVYTGNNLILHHSLGSLSGETTLGRSYRSRIKYHLRHKSLC